jgi:hypothetical protein
LADKFLAITLDNASNNDVFMRCLELDDSNDFSSFHHIRCFAHVLNLGAQAALAVISEDLEHLLNLKLQVTFKVKRTAQVYWSFSISILKVKENKFCIFKFC